MDAVRFRILGPLVVSIGDRDVELPAGRPRALLALLALSPGRTVSRDRIIDELWGDDPPATAHKAVQLYVSQLRKKLPEDLIQTRTPGYALEISARDVDLGECEERLAEGRAATERGDAGVAASAFREALALWRGPALAEFHEPFGAREAARLDELRLTLLEERTDAELALGHHTELVGELESLVDEHPLRERLCGQLMLALYRSGRQAEALGVYQRARAALSDELGIEPSPALRKLERSILLQEASLDEVGQEHPSASDAPDPPAAARSVPALDDALAFVGRRNEIETLELALDAALGGRGRLVMISGEPGIGKTRMAAELAGRAASRKAAVLWGRCYEREGAPPYWPWIEALRGFVSSRDRALLEAELGAGAAEIAEVVAQVRERIEDISSPPPTADPNQARFRLFDSISGFLNRVAWTTPLVIVLDDLHAADAESLLLLEFMARELSSARLLLVGTYRDVDVSRRHPLSAALAELTREGLMERVVLRGLDEQDVREFIEATAGIPAPGGLVRAVHAQTEGNALFLREVVRLLVQDDELAGGQLDDDAHWGLRIPEGVRDVIGRRLDRLSHECNEALAVASVVGRAFSTAVLNRLLDASCDRLTELMEEAAAARVIEELPDRADSYEFTHVLFSQTLGDELSTARRVRLHARIADELEQLYGDRASAHAAEIAHHLGEAASAVGSERLIRYSLEAGEQALATYAYDEAETVYERALAARESDVVDEDGAALLFGLGRAELATRERHELDHALASLRQAFDYYASVGDVARAVAVATHPLPPSLMYEPTGVTGLISRALELVPEDSAEAAHLLSIFGWFAGITDADYEGAADAFARALAISQTVGDAGRELHALTNAAYVDMFHLHWDECLERSQRAAELASRLGDARSETGAHGFAARSLAVKGDLGGAKVRAEAALPPAQAIRERYWVATAALHGTMAGVLEVDWEGARRASDVGLAAQPRDPRNLGLRALIEGSTGYADGAVEHASRLVEATESVPPPGPGAEHALCAVFLPLIDRTLGVADHLDAAEAAADRAVSIEWRVPYHDALAHIGAALVACARGLPHPRAYERLSPHSGTLMHTPPISIDRVLGLLMQSAGDHGAAAGHFDDALAFCEAAGYRGEQAWVAAEYAAALRGSGDPDHASRIESLEGQASLAARELGIDALAQRLAAQT